MIDWFCTMYSSFRFSCLCLMFTFRTKLTWMLRCLHVNDLVACSLDLLLGLVRRSLKFSSRKVRGMERNSFAVPNSSVVSIAMLYGPVWMLAELHLTVRRRWRGFHWEIWMNDRREKPLRLPFPMNLWLNLNRARRSALRLAWRSARSWATTTAAVATATVRISRQQQQRRRQDNI